MPVNQSTIWAATALVLISFNRADGAIIAGIALAVSIGRAMWANRRRTA